MTITHSGAVTASDQRVCVEPLACDIERFAEFLAGEGYALQTVKVKRVVVADLGRWLARRRLALAKLDEQGLKQFQVYRRASLRHGELFTSHQFLGLLRRLGVIPSLPHKLDRTALGRTIRDYEGFLSSERGLARATVVCYLPIVRRLLTERFGNKGLRLQDLRPADLHRFILREGQRDSRSHARTTVTALRSFLRFLHQRGAIKTDLAAALPGAAHWRFSHVPKSLSPQQVEQLLRSCDRSTPSGQRDYAILLLLARLGLRGGEVLAMEPGLGARRDGCPRQGSAVGTIAVAQRCGDGPG
jgi:Phage integrase, N-terminal SAM-like domain